MKKTNFFKYPGVMFRFCILCVAILCLSGCIKLEGAGETKSEVNQRHMRVINANKRQMQDDIDALFLLDRPSKMSDKTIR